MKDQINTIREALELHTPPYEPYLTKIDKALTALSDLEAMVVEPVAEVTRIDAKKRVLGIGKWQDLPHGTKLYAAAPVAQQPQAEAVPQDVGQLEYCGNSVAYIHQKMTAYRGAVDAAWQAMRDAGHPPDGRTPLAQAITKALAPQQAEAVPPGFVLLPVEPTEEMLAPSYMGKTGPTWPVRKEIYRAMIAAAQGAKT